jgi:hypothetical protein
MEWDLRVIAEGGLQIADWFSNLRCNLQSALRMI